MKSYGVASIFSSTEEMLVSVTSSGRTQLFLFDSNFKLYVVKYNWVLLQTQIEAV